MKLIAVAMSAVLAVSASQVLAQDVAAPATQDVAAQDVAGLFGKAQAEGKTLPEFVAQMTELKSCNPKLAERVTEFALEKAKSNPVLVEQVLKAVSNGCVPVDTVTAYAIGSGIDPTIVTTALNTATAANAAIAANTVTQQAAPAAGTATPSITPAAFPGAGTIGAGPGSGATPLASGN